MTDRDRQVLEETAALLRAQRDKLEPGSVARRAVDRSLSALAIAVVNAEEKGERARAG